MKTAQAVGLPYYHALMTNLGGQPIMDKGDDTLNQCFTASTVRKEVRDFMSACEALTGSVHQTGRLTDQEREIIDNYFLALKQEVAPTPLQVDEEIPLAATLSNVPLID